MYIVYAGFSFFCSVVNFNMYSLILVLCYLQDLCPPFVNYNVVFKTYNTKRNFPHNPNLINNNDFYALCSFKITYSVASPFTQDKFLLETDRDFYVYFIGHIKGLNNINRISYLATLIKDTQLHTQTCDNLRTLRAISKRQRLISLNYMKYVKLTQSHCIIED